MRCFYERIDAASCRLTVPSRGHCPSEVAGAPGRLHCRLLSATIALSTTQVSSLPTGALDEAPRPFQPFRRPVLSPSELPATASAAGLRAVAAARLRRAGALVRGVPGG